MKRLSALILPLALLAILPACAVYTPGGAVVVDPGHDARPAGRGGFCPPGQAKKGNC